MTGRCVMSEFTADDQWRSFQTLVAAYLAGMVHPRDVFTIARRSGVMPPLVEFRCDAAGRLWFSVGALSWSDEDDAAVQVSRENPNQVAAQTVGVLRSVADLNEPSDLRLSGSGPASAVAVLDTKTKKIIARVKVGKEPKRLIVVTLPRKVLKN